MPKRRSKKIKQREEVALFTGLKAASYEDDIFLSLTRHNIPGLLARQIARISLQCANKAIRKFKQEGR